MIGQAWPTAWPGMITIIMIHVYDTQKLHKIGTCPITFMMHSLADTAHLLGAVICTPHADIQEPRQKRDVQVATSTDIQSQHSSLHAVALQLRHSLLACLQQEFASEDVHTRCILD